MIKVPLDIYIYIIWQNKQVCGVRLILIWECFWSACVNYFRFQISLELLLVYNVSQISYDCSEKLIDSPISAIISLCFLLCPVDYVHVLLIPSERIV